MFVSLAPQDEVDSLMGRRSSEEHEASRRLKTEMLIQLDGIAAAAGGAAAPRVTMLAATNCPEDLDEAFGTECNSSATLAPRNAR
jgi:SpoVK/Ycf46/Vps4 family AAA+-type ATPase